MAAPKKSVAKLRMFTARRCTKPAFGSRKPKRNATKPKSSSLRAGSVALPVPKTTNRGSPKPLNGRPQHSAQQRRRQMCALLLALNASRKVPGTYDPFPQADTSEEAIRTTMPKLRQFCAVLRLAAKMHWRNCHGHGCPTRERSRA